MRSSHASAPVHVEKVTTSRWRCSSKGLEIQSNKRLLLEKPNWT